MSRNNKIVLLIGCLFLCPAAVEANAGTPLMWLGAFHLVIGNAIIGIVEGLLIAVVFKVRKRRAVPIMILANYLSTIAGGAGTLWLGAALAGQADLYLIAGVIAFLSVLAFAFSVILEWPFCLWILRRSENRAARAWRASLLAQTVSYVFLLAPLYFLASGFSLVTQTTFDKTLSFSNTNNAWIYFIADEDCFLRKVRPNGQALQKIQVLDKKLCLQENRYRKLIAKTDQLGAQSLWLTSSFLSHEDIKVVDAIPDKIPVDPKCLKEGACAGQFWTSDLRDVNARDWDVATGFWAIEGFHGENAKTGKKFHVALETPFVMWSISNATVLPDDQAIFQIGRNQIVLMDLNTRKIGLVARGFSPAVAVEK